MLIINYLSYFLKHVNKQMCTLILSRPESQKVGYTLKKNKGCKFSEKLPETIFQFLSLEKGNIMSQEELLQDWIY